jgi:hypothetical protein
MKKKRFPTASKDTPMWRPGMPRKPSPTSHKLNSQDLYLEPGSSLAARLNCFGPLTFSQGFSVALPTPSVLQVEWPLLSFLREVAEI